MGLHHHLAQTPGATEEWPNFAFRMNIKRVHDCLLSSLQLSWTLSVIVTLDLRLDLCLNATRFIFACLHLLPLSLSYCVRYLQHPPLLCLTLTL